jgi:hypothetical protein
MAIAPPLFARGYCFHEAPEKGEKSGGDIPLDFVKCCFFHLIDTALSEQHCSMSVVGFSTFNERTFRGKFERTCWGLKWMRS